MLVALVALCAAWPALARDRDATITAGDLDRVSDSLKRGDWTGLEARTAELIRRDSPGQRFLIARLRYMHVFAIAGQIEKRAIALADAERKLAAVQKRLILQPWHPVKLAAGSCLNSICADPEHPSKLMTTQTNATGTTIYSFEYFDMERPVSLDSFEGDNARLGGVLDKAELNPNLEAAHRAGSGVAWLLRLHVKDGFIDFER